MERISSGIEGFDSLCQGGFPLGSTVLVSGGTGTGKTIFAMQFLIEGAQKFKEPGLYVTLESSTKNISWDMESFSWNIKKLQDESLLKIYRLNLSTDSNVEKQIEAELEIIAKTVKELGIKRLVIDSTTAFTAWIKDLGKTRYLLYELSSALKELDVTAVITAETHGLRDEYSAFGVEEFVSDAVIAMYFTPPNRSIFIRKMRGTDHSKKAHPFDFGKKGLIVKPRDEVLWEAIKK